jgi:hypothetical protein
MAKLLSEMVDVRRLMMGVREMAEGVGHPRKESGTALRPSIRGGCLET